MSHLLQKSKNKKRQKRKSPLSFVFMGSTALVMKVMPKKSEIKGLRINIGILILGFSAVSITYKKQMAYILHFLPTHTLITSLSMAHTSVISMELLFQRPPVRTSPIQSAFLFLSSFKLHGAFVLPPPHSHKFMVPSLLILLRHL